MNLTYEEILEDIVKYSEQNWSDPNLPFVTGLSRIEVNKITIENALSIKIGEFFCREDYDHLTMVKFHRYAGRIITGEIITKKKNKILDLLKSKVYPIFRIGK